jgi:hypothetical protein
MINISTIVRFYLICIEQFDPFWKEDGQPFYKYQQTDKSPLHSNIDHKKRTRNMVLEIQIMTSYMNRHVDVICLLMGSRPFYENRIFILNADHTLCNTISPKNTAYIFVMYIYLSFCRSQSCRSFRDNTVLSYNRSVC